jgi:hypothetical protein
MGRLVVFLLRLQSHVLMLFDLGHDFRLVFSVYHRLRAALAELASCDINRRFFRIV